MIFQKRKTLLHMKDKTTSRDVRPLKSVPFEAVWSQTISTSWKRDLLRIDWQTSSCCSHWTLLHVDPRICSMRFARDGRVPASAKHSFSLGERISNSNSYEEKHCAGLVPTRLSGWSFCAHLTQKYSLVFFFADTIANLWRPRPWRHELT